MIARTDRPEGAGQDLSKRPLVAAAMAADNRESRGVWREGNDLYYALAVPVVKDFTPFGYLITGFQITDQAEGVREVREVSGADVAFVAAGPEGPRIVATTLPQSTARSLAASLKSDRMGDAMRAGKAVPRTELGSTAASPGSPWSRRCATPTAQPWGPPSPWPRWSASSPPTARSRTCCSAPVSPRC